MTEDREAKASRAHMTVDTDPAADGHRDLIRFLRQNATELGIIEEGKDGHHG